MNFLKNNKKIIAAFAAGAIITGGAAFAANEYLATNVKYTDDKTVAQALNELYDIKKNYILPSGTQNITANGNYDVTNKASVNVNVSSPKTLLWTNNSPNSDIASTDINLSSSLYDFSHMLIEWKQTTSSTIVYEDLYKVSPYRMKEETKGTYGIVSYHETGGLMSRAIRIKESNKLFCGNATSGSGEYITSYIIPLKIYGLNLTY